MKLHIPTKAFIKDYITAKSNTKLEDRLLSVILTNDDAYLFRSGDETAEAYKTSVVLEVTDKRLRHLKHRLTPKRIYYFNQYMADMIREMLLQKMRTYMAFDRNIKRAIEHAREDMGISDESYTDDALIKYYQRARRHMDLPRIYKADEPRIRLAQPQPKQKKGGKLKGNTIPFPLTQEEIMSINNMIGAVRDISIISLADMSTPLAALAVNGIVSAAHFENVSPVTELSNLHEGAAELTLEQSDGGIVSMSLKIMLHWPQVSNLQQSLPYNCMLLVSPYAMPKGQYYVIGDVYSPVKLTSFKSNTTAQFTSLYKETMELGCVLKELPPIVSFL